MAEILVIRLPAASGAPASWMAVDSNGTRLGSPVTGSLQEAAADVRERKLIVLVPGTEVLTTSADVPVRGGARLQSALPYALEEFVAEDIDKLHFAAGARRESGRVPVAVVSRERLDEWRDQLAEAGLTPAAIIPENHGLARIPGTISLLIAENEIMINDGADVELVMQGVSPAEALATIGVLDEGGEEDSAQPSLPRHAIVYCEPGDDERYRHDWIAMRQELESLDINLLPDGVMPRLAVTVATGAGINLLQGEYADQTEYGGLFRRWRTAAALLLGLVAVGLLAKAADLYLLNRQEAALREQFVAEYREAVPGAANVQDQDPAALLSSLRARTGRSEAPQVFLQSLEHLARALRENTDARIEALSYRSGVVDIRVTAPNVATLDGIQKIIRESGRFTASIQGTNQQGERVSSQIQIRESGA
ncbi:MAG TPA: type II secretion system protein GspL [Woeseiaceae bacterium]|nr:type II secretion system protein GspL [Woeseiaceae bacterium]